MLIKCDNCGQKYEVDDARLSPQGARIKCQKCAQIIVVRLPGQESSTPNSSDVTLDNPVFEDSQFMSQVGQPEKPESAENDVVPEGTAPWRVRHMGLTYTFHDLPSLRDWLSSRQSLDDIKVDQNETGWGEIGDFPEVLTTELITKYFPLGDVPKSKNGRSADAAEAESEKQTGPSGRGNVTKVSGIGSISPTSTSSDLSKPISVSRKTAKNIKREQLKAEKDRKAMKKKLIGLGILAVIVIIAVIVGLRFVKSGEVIPGRNVATAASEEQAPENAAPETAPENAEVAAPQPVPEEPEMREAVPEDDKPKAPSAEELERLAQEDIKKRFEEASVLVKDKKWPEARATLETLVREKPDDIEMLTLLSKTYKGLNLKDKAAEVDSEIKRLKSAK
ncbi:MAG: zinc-ribbon domain-containing protein [Proteobacteria bacterium]|nr:zinc-ribbon domain-containing protein [Pseudomonadota bacterium]